MSFYSFVNFISYDFFPPSFFLLHACSVFCCCFFFHSFAFCFVFKCIYWYYDPLSLFTLLRVCVCVGVFNIFRSCRLCLRWYIWIAPVLFLNDLKIINNGNNNNNNKNHNNNVNHACMKRTLRPHKHILAPRDYPMQNNDRVWPKGNRLLDNSLSHAFVWFWLSLFRRHRCRVFVSYISFFLCFCLRGFQLIHQKLLILIHRTGFFPSTFRTFFMIMSILYVCLMIFFLIHQVSLIHQVHFS